MPVPLPAHATCVLADEAPLARLHPQRTGSAPAAALSSWLAQQGFPGPYARAEDGETALMRAAWQGDASATAALLSRGVPVDAEDDQGRTALWYACLQGWPATIVQLLEAGADIDHADDDGLTCLMQAAASGRAELMALLRRLGASAAPCAPDGRAAADMATDRARELLRHASRLSA